MYCWPLRSKISDSSDILPALVHRTTRHVHPWNMFLLQHGPPVYHKSTETRENIMTECT